MTAPERSLSRGVVARYAIGSIGTGGFATLPGLVLVFYLTDTLGVSALFAGIVVTAAKVWDVVIDPVDRRTQRPGARRHRHPAHAGCGSARVALPVAFVVTFAVPAGHRALGIRSLGLHRVPRHCDRVQPVPGAVHRAARRAHRRLRHAHPPAHLAGGRAEPRDPALRRRRAAAATCRRRRRGTRLPRDGRRGGPRDRRRACSSRRSRRREVHRPGRGNDAASVPATPRASERCAAAARSATSSPRSCCRASPPGSCSRVRTTSPCGCSTRRTR